MTTESSRRGTNPYPEIDDALRKLDLTVPNTSFLYHMFRLRLLIQRKVGDKKLADEMLNELDLASKDLQREVREISEILKGGP